MSTSLEGSLRELADDASTAHAERAGAGAGLPVGRITLRARRRRVVKAALGAAGGIAAVTVLVLGMAAVRQGPHHSFAPVASQPHGERAVAPGIELVYASPPRLLIAFVIVFAVITFCCAGYLVLARASGSDFGPSRTLRIIRLVAGASVVGLLIVGTTLLNTTKNVDVTATRSALEQHYGLTFVGSLTRDQIPGDGARATVRFVLDKPAGSGTAGSFGVGALDHEGDRVALLQIAPGPGQSAPSDSQLQDLTGAISESRGDWLHLVEMPAAAPS